MGSFINIRNAIISKLLEIVSTAGVEESLYTIFPSDLPTKGNQHLLTQIPEASNTDNYNHYNNGIPKDPERERSPKRVRISDYDPDVQLIFSDAGDDASMLHWKASDYEEFKRDALVEIKHYAAENNLKLKEAVKVLYKTAENFIESPTTN